MRALRGLASVCRAVAPAHQPWTRGIAGNDLSRRAITAPNTVARVSEQQFLADNEQFALVKRKQKLRDEKRALEAADLAALEATRAENTPPKPLINISEDQIRNALLLTAGLAAGVGLYAS